MSRLVLRDLCALVLLEKLAGGGFFQARSVFAIVDRQTNDEVI